MEMSAKRRKILVMTDDNSLSPLTGIRKSPFDIDDTAKEKRDNFLIDAYSITSAFSRFNAHFRQKES